MAITTSYSRCILVLFHISINCPHCKVLSPSSSDLWIMNSEFPRALTQTCLFFYTSWQRTDDGKGQLPTAATYFPKTDHTDSQSEKVAQSAIICQIMRSYRVDMWWRGVYIQGKNAMRDVQYSFMVSMRKLYKKVLNNLSFYLFAPLWIKSGEPNFSIVE